MNISWPPSKAPQPTNFWVGAACPHFFLDDPSEHGIYFHSDIIIIRLEPPDLQVAPLEGLVEPTLVENHISGAP